MGGALVVVAGPTASGKTALAVALAHRLGGEVISADSMQIYQRMDIGTAKPTPEEMEGVPHHMLSIVPPGERYSVSRYEKEAGMVADGILQRGKTPIVCGGTGLYINALINGAGFLESGEQSGIRAQLDQEWRARGGQAMYEELGQIDPESALRLHPNDKKRVLRAIEVYRQTGVTITEHNRHTQQAPPRYRAVMLGLSPQPRELLYERIDRRVAQMARDGLVQEASVLWREGLLDGTAAQAIGYKELVPYLKGQCTLEQALDQIRQSSRRYAKRQLTWFQRDDRIHWIPYGAQATNADIAEIATKYLESRLIQ